MDDKLSLQSLTVLQSLEIKGGIGELKNVDDDFGNCGLQNIGVCNTGCKSFTCKS